MKKLKKIISILLIAIAIVEMFSGCSAKVESAGISNGEFYSLFIENTNMYNDKYSKDNIDNYKAAEALLYDRYLLDDDQLNKVNRLATKDIVAQVCVRYMEFRKTCNTKIKDISKCHDQQAVIDGVGMQLLDLENGYFNARKKMSAVDCQTVIDKMLDTELNSHYDEGELDVEFVDDAVILDDSIEIEDWTVLEETNSSTNALSRKSDISVTTLGYKRNNEDNLINTAKTSTKVVSFKIPTFAYERMNPKPVVNSITIKPDSNKNSSKSDPYFEFREPMAIMVTSIKKDDTFVTITGRQATAKEFLKDSNQGEKINKECNSKAGEIKKVKDNSVPQGLKINIDNGYLTVTFGHKFNITDNIYGKQKWRNPSFSPSVNITAKIGNFQLDTKNIGKLILGKKSEAHVKLTYETNFKTTFEGGGMRYSPANNGNGGLKYSPEKGFTGHLLTNVKNSRLTGASAGGSEQIKLAQVNFPIGKGFYVNMNLYLKIEFDGTFTFEVDGLHEAELKVSKTRTGFSPEFKVHTSKKKSKNININLTVEFQLTPNVSFWGLEIIDAVGIAGFTSDAMAAVYSKSEKVFSEKIYATETELNDYCNSTDFGYCMGASFNGYLGYQFLTTKSEIGKFVINVLGLKTPSDKKPLFSFACHFEDGKFVNKCTRDGDKLEKNKEGKIELASYKLVLDKNAQMSVSVESVPIVGKALKALGGISISSGNEKVAKATYNDATKTVLICAVGEGSTEITVKIDNKKKAPYTQQISVTVNDTASVSNVLYPYKIMKTFII